MKIALLDIQTKDKAVNKTMAGGLGTASSYNSSGKRSFFMRILEIAKKKTVKMPLIEFAYLGQIFQQRGHQVEVSCSDAIPQADLYILYISLVEHNEEIKAAKRLRELYPKSTIGFIGTFATVCPELFTDMSDFIVQGESEAFFLEYNGNYQSLRGVVEAPYLEDLDALPFPNWSFFRSQDLVHYNFFGNQPVFPVLGSRGCPFSCSYYCAYPVVAGSKIRYRSAEKIIEELKYLKKEYNAKAMLFRDPNFSVDIKKAKELCRSIIRHKLSIDWACETHLACMDKELVDLMYESGCQAITVGIETRNKDVIKQSRRHDVKDQHLEEMVRYCEDKGIKIMAGYIFGNLQDNRQSILDTIEYAKKINSSFAQFYISTPYPGTEYYMDIKDRIKTNNWELFNTYTLVFNHPNLSEEELEGLKQKAYLEFYFRPGWILKFLKGKLRDSFDRR